jgi:hypothetical protein
LPKQTALNRPVQDAGQFLGQCCHQLLVLLCLCELPIEWYLPNTPPDTIIRPTYFRSVVGGEQYLANRYEVHPVTIERIDTDHITASKGLYFNFSKTLTMPLQKRNWLLLEVLRDAYQSKPHRLEKRTHSNLPRFGTVKMNLILILQKELNEVEKILRTY